MGFFDNKKNVDDYIRMTSGYDGSDLIEILKKYLSPASTLLELGMGPGKDLDLLNKIYKVTGSDNSMIFIDLYKKSHPDAEVLLLDAVSLLTKRKYDCIFSNKVLMHLTREDVGKSFLRQMALLNKNGVAFHTFWYGKGEEFHHGLRFTYFTEKSLQKLIPDEFTVLESKRYTELEKNDSILVILKKTGG